jgi:hypothetical protein
MTIEKTSYSNSVPLRIKRINLADEARTIKSEERKAIEAGDTGCGSGHDSLYRHRMDVVRPAARTNHLAHAFLVGRPYAEVEQQCAENNRPNWERVRKTALRFGKQAGLDEVLLASRWAAWEAAGAHHIRNPPKVEVAA